MLPEIWVNFRQGDDRKDVTRAINAWKKGEGVGGGKIVDQGMAQQQENIQKKESDLSSVGVTDTLSLTLRVFGRQEDLMHYAEAHLTFHKCWLIISRADTVLFIPKGSRALYTKVDFSIC